MSSLLHAARRVLLHGLIAAGAAFAPPAALPALAQDDPFALPSGTTVETASRAGTPGLSEIVIDGKRRPRMVDLAWLPGGRLAIDAEGAAAAGLPVPAGRSGKVALDDLSIASWAFDAPTQVLKVALLRKSDGANLIDLSAQEREPGASAALTWARIDYDVTASKTPGNASLAGGFSLAIGRGNFVAGTSVTMQAAGGTVVARRLETQAQLLLPRNGLVATAGDFITSGSLGQRPVRVGGVQLASDYSMRPDLVTMPLPQFSGQVSVPTGVDILVAGQRTQIGQVEPGEFTVRNVPVSPGRGAVALIVKDTLGRETVQNVRFYASPQMLAPRLRQFAANIGFVRRRIGEADSGYGPLVASGFYRRGFSDSFTGEISGEWSTGVGNLGLRADLALAGVALASVETRISHSADRGGGTLINAAIESAGRQWSARAAMTLPSAGYQDVAMRHGDAAPARTLTGQISFDLRQTRLQLTAGRYLRAADPRRNIVEEQGDIANLSARTAIGKFNLEAAVAYRGGLRRQVAATLGLSFRFGTRGFAGASVTERNDQPRSYGVVFTAPESIDHPLGYSVEAGHGDSARIAGRLAWRPTAGTFTLEAQHDRSALSLRGNARGSLIVAGGGLFARNQTGMSYALVRSGKVGGIAILRENRAVGKTGKRGLLLIEDIPAHVPLSYDIDADQLPADVLARDTARRVVVPRRAVGLVRMDLIRFVPTAVRLTMPDGSPVAAGSVVIARPSGAEAIVGFDGMFEFNAQGDDRVFDLPLDGGSLCRFTIDTGRTGDAGMPVIACAPVQPGPAPVIALGGSGGSDRRGRGGNPGRR